MAAIVEIIIRDPDAPDPGSAHSPPPGAPGSPPLDRATPQAVLVVGPNPIPVHVVSGRFASGGSSSGRGGRGTGGGRPVDPAAVIKRNRAIAARADRRAAMLRERQRRSREAQAKKEALAKERGGKGGGRPANPAAVINRNRAVGARADRRAAALRDRQRKAREAQAKKEALAKERDAQREQKARERQSKLEQRQKEKERKSKERDAAKKAAQEKAKREEEGRAASAAVGAAAAAVIRGGGAGAAVGGALGGALGYRFGGPAGAAVGSAVGEKAGGAIDSAIPNTAGAAVKVARNDGTGLAADAVEGAASAAAIALLAIPVAGVPAAIAMQALGKTVGAANEVLSAFAQRGRELSAYSGALAGATAQQDVTKLLLDIREAQRFEGGFAKVIESQTKIEATLNAGLNPIREFILEKIPPLVDAILDGIIKGLEALDKVTAFDYGIKEMVAEMKKMRALLEGPGVAGDDILKKWLGDGDLGFKFPIGEKPKAGPLGIPLFAEP